MAQRPESAAPARAGRRPFYLMLVFCLVLLVLRAADLAESIKIEGKIENLLKAKGFQECMVYYDTEQLDVIVQSDGLDEVQAAQIRDVILGEVTLPEENISIVEVK